MILSVVIPDAPAGTATMLERELDGLDAEVIVMDWKKGLEFAAGEFICFLEEDSAVRRGTIVSNLAVFMENPLFRKLAMVTSPVDYPDTQNVVYGFTEAAQRRFSDSSSTAHLIRAGSVPGAVIRRSSLLKINPKFSLDSLTFTMDVCLDFWEAGQRIMLNPDGLYYAPDIDVCEKISYRERLINPLVSKEWERELVT